MRCRNTVVCYHVRNRHDSVHLLISRWINSAICGGRSSTAILPSCRRMAMKLSDGRSVVAGIMPQISLKKSCCSTSEILMRRITLISRLLNILYSAEREQHIADAKAVYDQCCSSTFRRIIAPMSISAILHLYIVGYVCRGLLSVR